MTSRSSSRRSAAEPADRVTVGRVLRAHGIRGELLIEALSDNPERFGPGARLRMDTPAGSTRTLAVTSSRPHKKRLLVRFEEISDRTAADELRGHDLFVLEGEVPEAPEGSYYHFQLEGCRVVDGTGDELGTVRRILEDGGGEILEVAGGGRTLLIPFVESFLREVDVDAKRIEVDLPDGLVDACGST